MLLSLERVFLMEKEVIALLSVFVLSFGQICTQYSCTYPVTSKILFYCWYDIIRGMHDLSKAPRSSLCYAIPVDLILYPLAKV